MTLISINCTIEQRLKWLMRVSWGQISNKILRVFVYRRRSPHTKTEKRRMTIRIILNFLPTALSVPSMIRISLTRYGRDTISTRSRVVIMCRCGNYEAVRRYACSLGQTRARISIRLSNNNNLYFGIVNRLNAQWLRVVRHKIALNNENTSVALTYTITVFRRPSRRNIFKIWSLRPLLLCHMVLLCPPF